MYCYGMEITMDFHFDISFPFGFMAKLAIESHTHSFVAYIFEQVLMHHEPPPICLV